MRTMRSTCCNHERWWLLWPYFTILSGTDQSHWTSVGARLRHHMSERANPHMVGRTQHLWHYILVHSARLHVRNHNVGPERRSA